MGGPCDHLVPAAILYKNPKGLTAEELSEELDKIGGETHRDKLDYSDYYHSGLYSVAKILCLPLVREIRKKNWDNNLKYFRFGIFGNLGKKPIKVIKEKRKVIGEDFELKIDELGQKAYEKGKYIDGYWIRYWAKESIPEQYRKEDIEFQVTSVLETKIIQESEFADDGVVKQRLKVRPIRISTQEEPFSLIESKDVKYTPKKVFDFSLKSGNLFPYGVMVQDNGAFRWFQRKGKYFLDVPFMMDHLSPNSVYAGDWRHRIQRNDSWRHRDKKTTPFSLTDLELTAEAIRTENWEVLSYIGFRRGLGDFLFSSPETLAVHEKAVWDNEMSQLAIKEGWTNTELLRQRIHMSMSQIPMTFEQKKEGFELEQRIKKEKIRKIIEENKKRTIEIDEDEIPF